MDFAPFIVAGLGGLVSGAFALGVMSAIMRQNTRAIKRMHDRFDLLVLALAAKDLIDASAVARLARRQPREGRA